MNWSPLERNLRNRRANWLPILNSCCLSLAIRRRWKRYCGGRTVRCKDSSAVSPTLARKVATACRERRVRFLDAPVTGGDWGGKKGELVFMVGGDAATLTDAQPLLRVLGKKWFHLGPNGA